MVTRDCQGLLSLPLAMVLLVSASASAGITGLLTEWKRQVQRQLKLDECVGKAAHELRDRMKALERLNHSIQLTRAAMVAASVQPAARAALEATLRAQALEQRRQLYLWKLRQMSWLGKRGCPDASGVPLPLPSLPWAEDPPDALGPRPLRLLPGHSPLTLGLRSGNRSSFAQVRRQDESKSTWSAHWSSPAGSLRADFD